MGLVHNRPTDAVKDWPIHRDNEGTQSLRARVPELAAAGATLYRMGACRIIVSEEPSGWHLSISCANRDPTWQEIATARYRLLGAVREMAMFLPPLDDYVNMHQHTFHLYEHPQRAGLILSASRVVG